MDVPTMIQANFGGKLIRCLELLELLPERREGVYAALCDNYPAGELDSKLREMVRKGYANSRHYRSAELTTKGRLALAAARMSGQAGAAA